MLDITAALSFSRSATVVRFTSIPEQPHPLNPGADLSLGLIALNSTTPHCCSPAAPFCAYCTVHTFTSVRAMLLPKDEQEAGRAMPGSHRSSMDVQHAPPPPYELVSADALLSTHTSLRGRIGCPLVEWPTPGRVALADCRGVP